ncbi:arylsulfatase [Microbacterium sp. STN6]|uniref:arylsulfatase n=1 Tax=Microbacterium sp. STN6 TaxID=2995588 RepID=UPI002260BBE0|nr:arylsulfatase [Microbacterium sp. STN6]MCX7522586.1 arylsulfatase [Microbacterium sp. STN6]
MLLIVADDMGYSDLGCYGGEIPTPVLDSLGRRGVRFSQFYNTARCSPSRASLLTGMHPHQTGIGVLTRPDLPHGYAGTLDPRVPTVAEMLQDEGYETALFGKWHLAADTQKPNASWPTRRGFGEFFGTLAGCSSYFDPQTLTAGERPASDAKDDPEFYYTDAIGTRARDWVQGRGEGAHPFFMYMAFTAPHWPLHALPADIEAVRGLFDEGWDELRTRRLERLEAEGILPEGTRLSERDPSQPAWDNAADRDWQVRRMEVYAAQLVALDRAVGGVVEALRARGELENTLILFLSDNGASAEELPLDDPGAFVQKDAAMRTGTRDGRPLAIGNRPEVVPGPENTYASYGVPWANLSNAPLRRYKRWVHEGGISTPLIVSWPDGGLAEGAVVEEPAQLVDVVPTIRQALGLGQVEAPEGRSLLPLLQGTDAAGATQFWEHIGNAAVRRGRWKLVRDYPQPWELYDIDADRTELDDLAAANPELVTELSAAWQEWADRVGVLPWDAMLERYRAEGLPEWLTEE